MGTSDGVLQGTHLIREMERFAPLSYAMEHDRVGLQIGDSKEPIRGVLVCLEITDEVIDEAIHHRANWIVTHHAIIYQPLTEIHFNQPSGRKVFRLCKEGINVYTAHTNLDAAPGGVNDVLAEKLGLVSSEVFIPHYEPEKLKKLVVFIPVSHHDQVLQALGEAGAGALGNYSYCSFNTQGFGTFLPLAGADPFIGQQGKLEQVNEVRLETMIKERDQEKIIQAMLDAHPYEEVAYDLYPLDQQVHSIGYGRMGTLKTKLTLSKLAYQLKSIYQVNGIRMVGDPDQEIQTVAILGGSGGKFFKEAKRRGADVYITGDVDYHTAQDAKAEGLCILDPGHYIEHHVVDRVCEVLREGLGNRVPIIASQVNSDPFRLV